MPWLVLLSSRTDQRAVLVTLDGKTEKTPDSCAPSATCADRAAGRVRPGRALGSERDREQLAALLDRLDAARLRVLVVGEAKRGKSTLVNALLSREVLPSGVTPLTAVATTVRYGDDERAQVRFLDGHEEKHPLAALPDLVTSSAGPIAVFDSTATLGSSGARDSDEQAGVSVSVLHRHAVNDRPGAGACRACGHVMCPARNTSGNLNVLNLRYPYGMREMGIQEARPVLGDLVRDAQRYGIETRLTRNGRPAARIARLVHTGGNAAECEKILARYADDPGVMLTDLEREAISVVRAILIRVAGKERDAC